MRGVKIMTKTARYCERETIENRCRDIYADRVLLILHIYIYNKL